MVTSRYGSVSEVVGVRGGRCRLVHVRKRGSSLAADALACPRRDSSISWLGKLEQVTQRRYTSGIEKWRRDIPGPRSPVSGRSPARVIRGHRRGSAGFEGLGSFTGL